MRIPFIKPDITQNEIDAVVDVLRSGWITTGPVTKNFEEELASYLDVPKVACVNSQTAGAELVLRLLGIGEGDEVILPAYTFTATCSVVEHVGATPVMIDSQIDSPEMDYNLLEEAITEKTKVIIPVDIAGIICDYPKIYQAIENKKYLFKAGQNKYQQLFNRIIILADTAHSLGAEINNVKAGNIADFSSFSFHAVKNLTTAEGGAVSWKKNSLLNAEEIYKELMLFSLHGQSIDALAKTQLGSWEYDIIEPLYKCNLSDIAAAIGYSQLKRYPKMLARRREIIRKYDEAFRALPLSTLNHFKDGQQSSGHLYFIRIDDFNEKERNEFIIKMAEKGISCNVHYKPLPMLSAYKKRGYIIEDYPNAFNYYKNLVTLPIYSTLTDTEVEYIISSIKKILK
ncbi:MAG: DegT/DnrJ/EryC1/StrS family aminotransferase [Clostridiaceae bacterium]|nr:DegT/DnrJ/EryC1/StrS family aminotransferase [Clostridiaceae bacterium]